MRLEDPDGDGKAAAPTVFADGFNAVEDGPAIGLVSGLEKGQILMASIPHVWDLRDTNGDGKADSREPLLSRVWGGKPV